MTQLFEDEKAYLDNKPRQNFVFLAYPYSPPIPLDDYRTVVSELQQEYPIRLWYFLDELTTNEMMRKIWRAILRADLAVFDISGGNPNVAFELGLSVAANRTSFTIVKNGEPNPLGSADLGYAERAEYSSVQTLKETLRKIITAKSSALKVSREVSYSLYDENLGKPRSDIESALTAVLQKVYLNKRVNKQQAVQVFGGKPLADLALNALRQKGVLQVEGAKKGAKWVFSNDWVYHDHEVAGL